MVSGLHPATTTPYSDSISLRLPYAVKLATECKSLTHYTKGTQSPLLKESSRLFAPASESISQVSSFGKAKTTCSSILDVYSRLSNLFHKLVLLASPKKPLAQRRFKQGLLLFVCTRFQDLFHSPSGVLFAFPSRYWFTIGRCRVFSLGGWSPHLQTGFLVSRPTCCKLSSTPVISCTGLSPAMAPISSGFHYV